MSQQVQEAVVPVERQQEDFDAAEEKRLVRKIDLRVFPAIWAMFVVQYLDRTNIGNARIAGLDRDLGLSDSQFSVALFVFFIGYLFAEVPSNMILTRSRPSIYIPSLVLVWGTIATLFGAVQNYEGLVVARFFLGFAEAGFFPGVLFLLSSWYRKAELARRIGWFLLAVALSGAFGGLLAAGLVESLHGVRGIAGWRWLFIIEGLITIGVAALAYLVMPDWPHTTRWLTEREKYIANKRIEMDKIGGLSGGAGWGHWKSFTATCKDWRTWVFVVMYFLVSGANTIGFFIPSISVGFGYRGTQAQLMTVPIYAVAAVVLVCVVQSADYFNERAFHTAAAAMFTAVCYAIVAGVLNIHVRYVFLCFGTGGLLATTPLIFAYLTNIMSHPAEKRAIAQALVSAIGNCAGIYGSYLWPTSSRPRFALGFASCCAFCGVTALGALAMHWLNKRYPYPLEYPDSASETQIESSIPQLSATGETDQDSVEKKSEA